MRDDNKIEHQKPGTQGNVIMLLVDLLETSFLTPHAQIWPPLTIPEDVGRRITSIQHSIDFINLPNEEVLRFL